MPQHIMIEAQLKKPSQFQFQQGSEHQHARHESLLKFNNQIK